MYAGGGGIGTSGTPILTAMNGGNLSAFTNNPAQVGSANTFISNVGAIKLAGVNAATNDFNLTSSGNITQSGAIVVGGTTNLTADTNPITATLTTAGNDFGTVSLAGVNSGTFGTVSVTDDQNAMSIGGNATTLSANAKGALTLTGGAYTTLNATSQNSILQSGALTAPTVNLNADTGTVAATLTTAGNDFGTVSLAGVNSGTFGTVSVTDDQNAMSIGGNATTLSANAKGALTLTGGAYTTLNATSQNSILQSGALTAPTVNLNADTGTVAATLTTAGNDFGTVSLAGVNSGTFGTVSVTDDQNAMSIGGNATTLSANAKGALTLTGGAYTTLNATSQNSILQSGALTAPTVNLNADTGTVAATLTTAGNDFGTVSLAGVNSGTFGTVSVTDDQNAMSIGGNATTLSANAKGALTLTGGAYTTLNATSQNSILQSGALTAPTVNLNADTGTVAATLTTAGNDFGTVSLAGVNSGTFGTVSVTDDQNAMSIGGNATTLSANAKGALTLTGGAYTTLNATSQNSILQSGALTAPTVNLNADTGTVAATLTTAGNDFGTVSLAGVNSGTFGTVSVTDDQNAMSIGGNATTLSANAKGALTLTGGAYTTLNATSQNSILQSGALTAPTVNLNADTGTVAATLTTAGNDFGTVSLAGVNSGTFGTVSVTDDQNAMSIGGNATTLSANAKGALTLTGGAYTTLNATSQNSILQSGALTAPTVNLNADTGTVAATLTTAGNDFGTVSLAGVNSGTFGTVSVTDDQNAMSIGGNATTLSANAKGALTLTGGAYTTLNATSQNSILQSGALTAPTVNLNADTGTVAATLTTAGNDFGTVSLAGVNSGTFGTVSVTDDQNAMSIGGNATTLSANAKGALTLTGGAYTTLNATSQNSILQSGALTAPTVNLNADTGTVAATLTTAGNDFGTVSLAGVNSGTFGTVSVTDDQNAMSIGGNATTLSANAKGALTLTGGAYTTLNATSQNSILQSGALTAPTVNLNADTGTVAATLTTAGNDFGTVSLAGVNSGTFGTVSVTDDQNAMSIGGNATTLSANAKGALTLTGGAYTTLNATSQNSILQSGALTAPTVNLNADTGTVAATLTTAGNDFGTVSLAGVNSGTFGTVSVTDDQNAMSIGGNATTLSANAKGALTLTGGAYTTLNATSQNSILQSGALTAPTVNLNADTGTVAATLTTAGNDFGTVSLAGVNSGTFGTVSVTDDQNAMSIGGNATTLSANAKGALTLTGGAYTTLNATSQNSILQSGALTAPTVNLNADTGTVAATLTTAGNDFGTVSLAGVNSGTFGPVSVTDDQNAMSIGGNATTLSANAKGALTLTGGAYTTLNATSRTRSCRAER